MTMTGCSALTTSNKMSMTAADILLFGHKEALGIESSRRSVQNLAVSRQKCLYSSTHRPPWSMVLILDETFRLTRVLVVKALLIDNSTVTGSMIHR